MSQIQLGEILRRGGYTFNESISSLLCRYAFIISAVESVAYLERAELLYDISCLVENKYIHNIAASLHIPRRDTWLLIKLVGVCRKFNDIKLSVNMLSSKSMLRAVCIQYVLYICTLLMIYILYVMFD